MAGQYFRGAFIEFTSAFLVPIPNIILFQYNPETLSHTWTPAASAAPAGQAAGPGSGNPLAVTGDPGARPEYPSGGSSPGLEAG